METTPQLHRLVAAAVAACQAESYQVEIFDSYFIEISDGTHRLQVGTGSNLGFAPINSLCSVAIDKTRTLQLLQRAGFRTAEGASFFTFAHPQAPEGQLPADALIYAQMLGYPVFAKPNSGSLSKLAAAVYTDKELSIQIAAIAPTDHLLRIEKIIQLPEYRLVMVDGEFQYSCRKEIPKIIGDGAHNIETLVMDFNARMDAQAKALNEVFEPTDVDNAYVQNQLQDLKLTPQSILAKGVELSLAATPITRQGGTKQAYRETISEATCEWMKQLGETLNLRFFGLDVFADGPIDSPDNLIVLEVNHNPIHRHVPQSKVESIMQLVLSKYFEEQRVIREYRKS